MDKIFNQKNQKSIRRSLRKSMPKGEIVLWNRLKNKKLGYKFRRQHGIGDYVVDFYCSKFCFAVEVDGLSHDFDDKVIYDKKRQEYIESKGIKIKKFSSQEIFEDIESVIDTIYFICRELEKKKKDKRDKE